VNAVSVLGTGYVGLCTAVCFADRGYEVIASTYDRTKVDAINRGIPPFYEPQLEEMLARAVSEGRLRAEYGRENAIRRSDVTFITVGTPSDEDGSVDLQFIEAAAREVGQILREKPGYHELVVKSTVVPGTTENLVKPLVEAHSGKRAGVDFGLTMSPEFLRQGAAIQDTLEPDRIVIGEHDARSGAVLAELLREFYRGTDVPMLRMRLSAAEMIKYVNNAFLATKISFINEIANICERTAGVNVDLVAQGIGLDDRIAPRFLEAGPGWGGSCFPKDVKALIAYSRGRGVDPSLLTAVVDVNATQAEHVVSLARSELGDLAGKTIAVLGLAFKPETSDTRASPAFRIIDRLLAHNARVKVYDPQAIANTRRAYGDRLQYSETAIDSLVDADCGILVTHWSEFRALQPATFRRVMRQPVLIDTRRLYDEAVYAGPLRYRAIGLG
jgi:UDPglucose 6-dehydrogenase